MTEKKNDKTKLLFLFLRIVRNGIGIVFILLLIVFGLLNLSSVQTYLAQKGSIYLSERSKYPIHLDKIHVKWFDITELQGVHIKDLNNQTLIYAKSIEIDYTLNQSLIHI